MFQRLFTKGSGFALSILVVLLACVLQGVRGYVAFHATAVKFIMFICAGKRECNFPLFTHHKHTAAHPYFSSTSFLDLPCGGTRVSFMSPCMSGKRPEALWITSRVSAIMAIWLSTEARHFVLTAQEHH